MDLTTRARQAPAAAASSSSSSSTPAVPLSPKGTSLAAGADLPPPEPEKLAPPAEQLIAPLDTMRPDGMMEPAPEEKAAASASSSSSAAAVDVSPRSDQPNVLDAWGELSARLKGKQLIVFLDYDGTLTPIVSEPSQAIISEAQRERLAALARKCPVSIVTGRKVATIQKFILGSEGKPKLEGLERLYFAGSHGFDIRCPVGSAHSNKSVADDFLPQLKLFYDKCLAALSDIPGAFVEDNTYSISIHYRNVPSEADVKKIDENVTEILRPFELAGTLQRFAGKMVHEIRPNIDWHKGAAVHYLMDLVYPSLLRAELGASKDAAGVLRLPDGREVCPVYVGDDTTDEDAFRLLRRFDSKQEGGGKSLSIFVRADEKARPSAANFVLRSPEEVGQLLQKLAEIA